MQWRKNETNYLATYGAFGEKKQDESKLLRILYRTTSESALDVQNLFVCNLVVKLFVYPSMKRKPETTAPLYYECFKQNELSM